MSILMYDAENVKFKFSRLRRHLKELCHVPDWLDKQKINKRFTFASLGHPKFVNKLNVALLFFSFKLMLTELN